MLQFRLSNCAIIFYYITFTFIFYYFPLTLHFIILLFLLALLLPHGIYGKEQKFKISKNEGITSKLYLRGTHDLNSRVHNKKFEVID